MSREMKDSKILWIGNIPQNWNILRIKNTSWLKGRIGWDGLKADEFQDNGPYLITGTDFQDGYVNWDTCVHITEERFAEDELLHIYEGDLLITKDGTIGKLAIAKNCPDKVSLNSGVMIIRNNSEWKYNERFLYYVLDSEVFSQWFESEQKPGSTIKHLYQHQFGEFQFPLPPLSEQRTIISYLDAKCSSIDESIARLKKIIEKLEEYKTAEISRLTTKGVGNTDYIDSGVDIIGSVPALWELRRLKYLCDITTGDSDTQDRTPDGAYPFYVRSPIVERSNHVTFEGEGILMAGDGAGAGRIFHLAYGKYAVHQRVYRLYNIKGILPELLLAFLSVKFPERMNQGSAMSTVPSVRLPMLKDFIVPVPPAEEQIKIVAAIRNVKSYVEKAMCRHEKLISTLEEYRKSLIYNAVTGKIDCRTESVE